jgi:hypothetical protein
MIYRFYSDTSIGFHRRTRPGQGSGVFKANPFDRVREHVADRLFGLPITPLEVDDVGRFEPLSTTGHPMPLAASR